MGPCLPSGLSPLPENQRRPVDQPLNLSQSLIQILVRPVIHSGHHHVMTAGAASHQSVLPVQQFAHVTRYSPGDWSRMYPVRNSAPDVRPQDLHYSDYLSDYHLRLSWIKLNQHRQVKSASNWPHQQSHHLDCCLGSSDLTALAVQTSRPEIGVVPHARPALDLAQ